MLEIILINGRKLLIWEDGFKDMGGEPTRYLKCRDKLTKEVIIVENFLDQMNEKDRIHISDWINDLNLMNNANAIAWTI